jgi:maltooligosyltrehalose trehalohydrolase
MRFQVWAPGRKAVSLLLGEDEAVVPMKEVGRGLWEADASAGPGTRYRYSLDGGPPRPDPRSMWQPEGIEGASAVVDHDKFSWTDSSWEGLALAGSVLYELHVGTFSPEGTFDGAIGHLGHLGHLGVDAVEVMPVAEASGTRGWGYDGAYLWAPHHCYGGPQGFKRFVDACHARGLAVVLDVVYNHLGPVGNYLAEFGPYFTDTYRTAWGSAVNFDGYGSYGVRDFVVANALMWLRDYHLDGLRLDAVHAVHDEGPLHIVEELTSAVDALAHRLGRQLWVVVEDDRNDPRAVRDRAEHGWGATACWDDDFHHALHTVLTGESHGYYADFGRVGQLAKAFRDGWAYDGQFSEFRQRRQGRPAGGLPGSAFVCFAQNHDQVGNRPLGERLAHLVGAEGAKVAAALVLTAPFVPMLFQGEEWGASSPFLYFTDHSDPELAAAVSEGRRREHGAGAGEEVPDPQELSTFLRSKLDWAELTREPHRSLLTWYRDLLALRKGSPELSCCDRGEVVVECSEELRWLALRRGKYVVAANFAREGRSVPLGCEVAGLVLASSGGTSVEGESAWLPACSVAVALAR